MGGICDASCVQVKNMMMKWERSVPGIFDVRGRQYGQAKMWSSPKAFGKRAYFRTASTPAQLLVEDVKLADEGVYRCRVDFRNSPTRNQKINLTVIEAIEDVEGNEAEKQQR
ncbi:Uncharacterized protein GBIM_08211 [Gryllus bimaculatus]|nr:Uncharacterized protein GBIM_08211 [Gryllus bimaculatus]